MSLLNQRCKHCGMTAMRLALFAMAIDAGCSTNVSVDACPDREDGGEHDFEEPAPRQEAKS